MRPYAASPPSGDQPRVQGALRFFDRAVHTVHVRARDVPSACRHTSNTQGCGRAVSVSRPNGWVLKAMRCI